MRTKSVSSLTVVTVAALIVSGCDADPLRGYFVERTPRELYEAALREAGLSGTALARDWTGAGRQALTQAAVIRTPYRELGYLDPANPRAEAFRVELLEGQQLIATVELGAEGETRLFIDLFVLSARDDGQPVLLATADSLGRSLRYVARRDGTYLLRVQPELLRGGRYTLTVDITASLDFPVFGHDTRAIRSRFGVARDGGRRRHHGVDIFAPRGTPVIAASPGRVRWVGANRLGGKVVWMREQDTGYSLYYAHLDSQIVGRGALVKPGDTLGFVGNSGNARTTPPHLHFGIYLRGRGPVDPAPFLEPSTEPPAPLTADTGGVAAWVRATGDGIRLRRAPFQDAEIVGELAQHTALLVLAATGQWYRIALPDGSAGFVAARLTEPAARPVRLALASSSLVREWPRPSAVPVDSVPLGRQLPVLGVFRDFAYVTTPSGRTGWVEVD